MYAFNTSGGGNTWSTEGIGYATPLATLGHSSIYFQGYTSSLLAYTQSSGTYVGAPVSGSYVLPASLQVLSDPSNGTFTDLMYMPATISGTTGDYVMDSGWNVKFHWTSTNLSSKIVLSLNYF